MVLDINKVVEGSDKRKQELVISLKGAQSDTHQVPAFAALDSAHAVAQALLMTVHFAQTGTIRRRKFKELDLSLDLKVTRAGSFEFVFEFSQFAPYLLDAYGKGFANASWKLIETVFKRAIGSNGAKEIEDAESDGRINSGDLGALIAAVEPSVRRSHSVVNNGAANITINVNGDANSIVLNSESKAYMHENIFNDKVRSKNFLVTSFDGRNRTGRLFDVEEEQAFTFELLSNANRDSLLVIVDAARAYALRQKGKLHENMQAVIAFTSVDAPDGRKKRLKVFAAAKDYSDLDTASLTSLTKSLPKLEIGDDFDVLD